jgi:hypothetical protein
LKFLPLLGGSTAKKLFFSIDNLFFLTVLSNCIAVLISRSFKIHAILIFLKNKDYNLFPYAKSRHGRPLTDFWDGQAIFWTGQKSFLL